MKHFESLEKPLIYLVTKGETTAENFREKRNETLETIENAVLRGISLIQIREKSLSAKLLFELTAEAARITKKSETALLVNDRADIALAAGAGGVHLTGKSLSTETVRRSFPENFIVGVSAHSLEEILDAKRQKADFAVLSPIFPVPDKGEPLGAEKLREVCESVKPFPVLALGGINETNYETILEIADGFAAIRFLNDAENLLKFNAGI